MDRTSGPGVLTDVPFTPDIAVIEVKLPDRDRWRPLTGRWGE
jgi:hypothetical protein